MINIRNDLNYQKSYPHAIADCEALSFTAGRLPLCLRPVRRLAARYRQFVSKPRIPSPDVTCALNGNFDDVAHDAGGRLIRVNRAGAVECSVHGRKRSI